MELFYWREGDKEVDFIVRHGDSITAIEVKSGQKVIRRSGMDLFVNEFKPRHLLLVGEDGIPVVQFLKTPIVDFVS